MKCMGKGETRKLSVLLIELACLGGLIAVRVRDTRARAEVGMITGNMTPVCAGRFLVDLPAQAKVHLSYLNVQGFDVFTLEEGEAAFRLRVRGKREIPAGTGFCVERGVFSGLPSAHGFGISVMHADIPGHPELAFEFEATAGGGDSSHFMGPMAGRDVTTWLGELLRITKLRERWRTVNGIDGMEVLERVRELNLATTYDFNWDAAGAASDPLRPFLHFELQTGFGARPGARPVDESFDGGTLVTLWGSIAPTVRLRKDNAVYAIPEKEQRFESSLAGKQAALPDDRAFDHPTDDPAWAFR